MKSKKIRTHQKRPKNIPDKEYENLSDEYKGEIDGKRLILVGPPSSKPLVEGTQFVLKGENARCSHIGFCRNCGYLNIINSKSMCRNCYVNSLRVAKMDEERKRKYELRKKKREENLQYMNVKQTYPGNIILDICLTPEQKHDFRERKLSVTTLIAFINHFSDSRVISLDDTMEKFLSPKERSIVLMKFSQHMSFNDISHELHVSRARVSVVCSQAISKLRVAYSLAGANFESFDVLHAEEAE